jgi:hypothetical protein
MLASFPGWQIAATPAASGPLLKESAMHRKALTLVEMLVALALTIFLMAILSEAFVTGLRAFRRLKAVADIDQQLRTVAHALRRDLQAEHFEGGRRLSSYTLDQPLASGGFDRPALGYFCVREGFVVRGNVRITSELEGVDTVARPSLRDVMLADANGQLTPSDALAFTVRLAGNRPEEHFYGAVPLRRAPLPIGPPAPPQPLDTIGYPPGRFDNPLPDGRYSSQWAEVVYFLERDGTRMAYDETTNTMLPLFRLHRVQLLLVPEAQTVPQPPDGPPPNDGEALNRVEPYAAWDDGSTIHVIEDAVPFDNYFAGNVGLPTFYRHDASAWAEPQANGRFRYRYNSPADVQFRERRFGGLAGNYRNLGSWSRNPRNNVARLGADVLAVNVLSFDVKVYDPLAIRRTRVQGGQVDTIPEFVDLGQGLSQPLPMPQTDGTYAYAWNFGPAPIGVASSLFLGPGSNPTLPCTFDTWTNRRYVDPNRGIDWDYLDGSPLRALPYAGPLQAIQIRIRVWDEKTRQTRELTLIQDL